MTPLEQMVDAQSSREISFSVCFEVLVSGKVEITGIQRGRDVTVTRRAGRSRER